MFIKAYAESGNGGKAGYERAVARQLANETGFSYRQARKVTRANAGGNAPFTGKGRRSTNTNVRRNALNTLRAGRK